MLRPSISGAFSLFLQSDVEIIKIKRLGQCSSNIFTTQSRNNIDDVKSVSFLNVTSVNGNIDLFVSFSLCCVFSGVSHQCMCWAIMEKRTLLPFLSCS